MRLAFYDTVAQAAYSSTSGATQALGGTEATVVRIADAFGAIVAQKARDTNEGRYRSSLRGEHPTHIVALRDPVVAVELARVHPHSSIYLWLHDLHLPGMDRAKKLAQSARAIRLSGIVIVAVSDFHAEQICSVLLESCDPPIPRVVRIYNPVVIPSLPAAKVDPYKLVFFSSPHKGLDYAVDVFRYLRIRQPQLKLYVGNPGYFASAPINQRGIKFLGSIPREEALAHTAEALCTFAPNYIYPETFGLVLAESNAVGTPVLAHDVGAALEIVGDRSQFVPVPFSRRAVDALERRFPSTRMGLERAYGALGGFSLYSSRIKEWTTGARPAVQADPRFRLENVLQDWRAVLSDRVSGG